VDATGTARRAHELALLVENIRDYAIFLLDDEGTVLSWNAGAERLKGYAAGEIVGRPFSTFYPDEDREQGRPARILETARREGRYEEEGWRVRKDGSRFWASVVITAIHDEDGAILGFGKVTRDLTERRAAEEERRELAAERAAVAEKARLQEFQERFLAILGHDLRNPLASIDMGTDLLRHRCVEDAPALRTIDRIDRSARRMSRMIEQILDLTRSRLAGGLEIRPAPVELCTFLSGVIDDLQAAHPSLAIELR
jgi:PAS domain S-box-containing protein